MLKSNNPGSEPQLHGSRGKAAPVGQHGASLMVDKTTAPRRCFSFCGFEQGSADRDEKELGLREPQDPMGGQHPPSPPRPLSLLSGLKSSVKLGTGGGWALCAGCESPKPSKDHVTSEAGPCWGLWPFHTLSSSGPSDWQGLCLLPHSPTPQQTPEGTLTQTFYCTQVKTAQTHRAWHRKGVGRGWGR